MIELLELIAQFAPSSWRSLAPMAMGIGSGLAIYFLSGKDPAAAALAFAVGLLGTSLALPGSSFTSVLLDSRRLGWLHQANA